MHLWDYVQFSPSFLIRISPPRLTEGIRCQRPISRYYFSEVANPSPYRTCQPNCQGKIFLSSGKYSCLSDFCSPENQNLILSLSGEYHVDRHTERGTRILSGLYSMMGLPSKQSTGIHSNLCLAKERGQGGTGKQKMAQEDSVKCCVGFKVTVTSQRPILQ